MAFLRNTWYCAGWAYELEENGHYARKILGESVLVMRKVDGTVAAMGNACPHRFAPLHKGPRNGDVFACPYHGLQFNSDGQCVLNPNEEGSNKPGTIPKKAKVKTYPLVERWGALWIWMGDIEKADADKIPDFSMASEREGWACVRGMHATKAHYELVVDNLMDRTHVQYLHPILIHNSPRSDKFQRVQRMEQTGDMVWDYHSELHAPSSKIQDMMWPDQPEDTTNFFDVRWEAPGNMLLHAGSYDSNNPEIGSFTEGANLITPADEENTFYFWSQCRNREIDNEEVNEGVRMGVGHTFEHEDGAMVADVRELMGTDDLMSLNPVFLPSDAGAVRVRRIMAKLIEAEQAETERIAAE